MKPLEYRPSSTKVPVNTGKGKTRETSVFMIPAAQCRSSIQGKEQRKSNASSDEQLCQPMVRDLTFLADGKSRRQKMGDYHSSGNWNSTEPPIVRRS